MRIFTSKGEEFDNTTSHKLLGIYVDQDLSFNEHVEQLCKKLIRRIGLLRSIRQYLPLNERVLFYSTTIFFAAQSVFLYGGTVWSSASKCNIRGIFRVQKRAAPVTLSLKMRDERTETLFKRLYWLPFYNEINVNILCLLYKCLNRQGPEYLGSRSVSDLSTITSCYGAITIRHPRYNRATEGGKTFLITAAKLWNSLLINIRSSTSINAFKQNFCNFLKQGYAGLDSFPTS